MAISASPHFARWPHALHDREMSPLAIAYARGNAAWELRPYVLLRRQWSHAGTAAPAAQQRGGTKAECTRLGPRSSVASARQAEDVAGGFKAVGAASSRCPSAIAWPLRLCLARLCGYCVLPLCVQRPVLPAPPSVQAEEG